MPLALINALVLASVVQVTVTLDNGLARKPPMGWMTWERFRCNTNCKDYPDDCISERLIKSTADAMVTHKFKAAGYEYVSIDDCWLAKNRSTDGKLVPDAKRFPSGIKALSDYVHSRGLKLGIYEDTGSATCAGYPGSQGHYRVDAQTFAEWGVDMLKFDGCNTPKERFNSAWAEMSKELNATGRPIMYACEWPIYLLIHNMQADFNAINQYCNMYRSYNDIQDSWESLYSVIKYFGDHPGIAKFGGPGHWNDPDQLIVGDFGLSHARAEMQMALWCVMAAPLIVSADVRNMNPAMRDILLNPMAIKISQDPLGIMGKRIRKMGQVEFWQRPIAPSGSFALAIIYTNIAGGPSKVAIKLSDLGFATAELYHFTNVFTQQHMGVYRPWSTLDLLVNPTSVVFIHAEARQ